MRRISPIAIACAISVTMAVPVSPLPLQPDIAQARSNCLTVDHASLRIDGLLRASGRENVFEHRVVVDVRAASSRMLVRRAVIGRNGRWSAAFFVLSPRDQKGTLEALSISPKDGSIACLARRHVRVPFTSPTAQRLVYRARADVDGDGRRDVITLRKTSRTTGAIDVTLASGRHVSAATRSLAAGRPALVRTGNVNGRPGSELFVELDHTSTSDAIGIYTLANGRLRLAGTLPTSGHPGLFSGITCGSFHRRPIITLHSFVLRPQTGTPRYWTRTDSRYVWRSSMLVLDHTAVTVRLSGTPPPGLVGVRCGQPPA